MTCAPSPSFGGSLLFVPADRPDRFDKAVTAGADHVVVDLEDAVAPQHKAGAREHALEWLGGGNRAIVRANGVSTPWHAEDLGLVSSRASAILLPKCEEASVVGQVVISCAVPVLALIETPAGVASARAIARTGVVGLVFGNVDFAACLGIDPASHAGLQVARSSLAYASAEAGLAPPIDGVTTGLRSADALAADLAHARELGFGGKLCIHPAQVEPTKAAFVPTPAEIAWATAVVSAPRGTTAVNGEMVDPPVAERARRILSHPSVVGSA